MDTQVSEKNLSAYENAPLWKSFVSQLNPGMVAELCSHSVLQFESEEAATLLLDKEFGYLKEAVEDAALHAAFEEYFVRPIKIKIEVSTDHAETPRQEARRLTDESLKEADEATKNDPLVQELQSQMGARIVSATPVNNTSADESGGTGENNDSKS